ncbi:hypothetical protein SEA_BISKIT_61 [Gordonia phage Biskit]|uniref:Uncharacterized protein n=4 Tax=Emalynvirus troje TaxID=2560511 RepID=A0A2K9VER1_9CAUD|nr:hypothetical protein FDJ27_gp61 [Gordonia phage Troje]AXH45159.1 hypothetical protein SEA_SKETCHMEX_59 [Gordonia phage SketchMex]QDM56337.1 hypothetical protein SEA_SWEATNTEARS_61 [Gordonia phage SweatNTears]QNJ59491.1 hypothetical protein SEA_BUTTRMLKDREAMS_61 [Gordonia phage Buttrmlkdreams]QWY84934.1 hypothetical protein SEA_MSCARN_63 [Gordonia phage MScarn]UVK62100.1 hypothetical protein SEA_BISKIT_61 [Gordonia phage Biskit]WKW85125.1 hypothetical protein SEA_YUMMY_61 [Gordonia phage Yu
MEERTRAHTILREAFSATPHDISAYDLYDLVVNRRGISETTYRKAKKDMCLKSYRVGKKWYIKNPEKNIVTSLEDDIEKALIPLARGVEWEDFLSATKIALKRVRAL